MNKNIKLIIFDLDGVLINSFTNMRIALKRLSFYLKEKIDFNIYKENIGLPFEKIMQNMKIKGDHKKIKERYIKFSEQNLKKIKISKNNLKILRRIRKYHKLAIFTSKDRKRTLKILKRYNLFNTYITADDVINGKPNPEGLLKIIKKFKVEKKNCYYVGDTIYDFYAAKNAKINYLHASWGLTKKIKIRRIRYIKTLAEIKKIVEKINSV
ncbi:HAD family hydrolase [Candidatus Pelagibacter communis]|uniref:HAD family hydrolase n=1 Tax=Pelagibacter ubique TaxID=198252 RepID=UPI00094DACD3|nr:HAD-IA family hydrolase [Candidatus Pelagibacter ubique]